MNEELEPDSLSQPTASGTFYRFNPSLSHPIPIPSTSPTARAGMVMEVMRRKEVGMRDGMGYGEVKKEMMRRTPSITSGLSSFMMVLVS